MSKSKTFKVGDKVKLVRKTGYLHWTDEMDELVGEVGTVVNPRGSDSDALIKFKQADPWDQGGFWCPKEALEVQAAKTAKPAKAVPAKDDAEDWRKSYTGKFKRGAHVRWTGIDTPGWLESGPGSPCDAVIVDIDEESAGMNYCVEVDGETWWVTEGTLTALKGHKAITHGYAFLDRKTNEISSVETGLSRKDMRELAKGIDASVVKVEIKVVGRA